VVQEYPFSPTNSTILISTVEFKQLHCHFYGPLFFTPFVKMFSGEFSHPCWVDGPSRDNQLSTRNVEREKEREREREIELQYSGVIEY
jgi:hypothetical protein